MDQGQRLSRGHLALGTWMGQPHGSMRRLAQLCGHLDPLYVTTAPASGLGELLDQPNVVCLTAVRLKFLTFEWRASDLIEIAHPQFRDELSRQAVANGLNIPGLSRLRWPPEAFYSNGA